MGRLRPGELLAAVGALGLGVTLLLDWFGTELSPPEIGRTPGWETLGWLLVALLGLAILAAAWLVVSTLRRDAVAPAVAAGVVTATLGTIALLALAVRLALAQPGSDDAVAVLTPAYLGLLACALIAAGGWWSVRDERTEARQSAYVPPPPRAVPPVG